MASFIEYAKKLLEGDPYKVGSTSARRVRIQFNGKFIADTTNALYIWEHNKYPYFYVPKQDCSPEFDKHLVTEKLISSDGKREALVLEYPKNPRPTEKVSTSILSFIAGCDQRNGFIRFEFGEMDQWYEEDIPIYVHPKDPTKRIFILTSSRPIEVLLDGVVVAESSHSLHLLEPLLPNRYYLPRVSVDPAILIPSSLKTQCPYKGEAEYFHLKVKEKIYKNLIWYYRNPTLECSLIAGALCFYNEKVTIRVDGQRV